MTDALYNGKIMVRAQAVGFQMLLDAPAAPAAVEVGLNSLPAGSGDRERRIVAVAHRIRSCALCQGAANALAKAAPGHAAASVR